MNGILWNTLLAVVWAAITGSFAPGNIVLGFALGFVVLFVSRRAIGLTKYAPRLAQALALAGFFIWDLFLSNVHMAYDVLRPTRHLRPGVIAIPLEARTDAELTLLANLVTLTPGSLSLDISADRETLYIHAMHVEDPEAVRQKIKNGFERRILAVTR